MITSKTKSPPFTRVWPYTPEPSPPLEATEINIALEKDYKMASENVSARPINVTTKKESGILSPGYRPTLDDVLNGKAPAPYTLAAYTAFLSQQHCLETLEFVTASRKYADKYEELCSSMNGTQMTTEMSEGFELMQDWVRIMDVYVKPGAPREINLPAEERDDLVDEPYEPRPPKPEALDPAVQRMRDLMSDSIFIPFCNSVKTASLASTYNALSDLGRGHDLLDLSYATYDDRSSAHRRQQSGRKRSPPTSSGFSRSPPQTSSRASALTSALNRNSSSKVSQNTSNTSATSDGTNESRSSGSTHPGDLESILSPPLTPPASDIAQNHPSYLHPQKASRSESGGWKKMGMKIFGAKKKGSFHEE